VRDLLRSAWTEPAPPDPPARGWRDWTIAAVAVALAVFEGVVRSDLPHRFVTVALTVALVPTLLWRRTRPLAMVAVSFVIAAVATLAGLPDMYSTAFVLLLPYALFRWGSGRAVIIGLALMVVDLAVVAATGESTASDAIGGGVVLLATMALGAAGRYRTRAKSRELEQARLVERERLARDLHDTVAHHVSAIAVRAQAGLAVAQTRPEAATEALTVIEAEASRALAEMRAIVRVLRTDDAEPRIRDLTSLVEGVGTAVEIRLSGDLDSVAPAVQTALYHLARESVTNARRHARGATRIAVEVRTDDDAVHLVVADDGMATAAVDAQGFGLVGMAERAGLVGGVCAAGPNPDRGWTVTATLPRLGATA
jgi:signal transduction histidine kinase